MTPSQLETDLEQYAHEAFTKKDVIAGLQLMFELVGLGTLFGAAFFLYSIPGLNAFGRSAVAGLSNKLMEKYSELNAGDRRLVRAVVSWAFPDPSAFSQQALESLGDATMGLDIIQKMEDLSGMLRSAKNSFEKSQAVRKFMSKWRAENK